MRTLCIYAYPAQLIKIQLIDDDSIISEENCVFNAVIRIATKYIVNDNVKRMIVIGHKVFTEKIANAISQQFDVPVERLYDND